MLIRLQRHRQTSPFLLQIEGDSPHTTCEGFEQRARKEQMRSMQLAILLRRHSLLNDTGDIWALNLRAR
jgi:hypothetical protein